jgi:hypothetical protein
MEALSALLCLSVLGNIMLYFWSVSVRSQRDKLRKIADRLSIVAEDYRTELRNQKPDSLKNLVTKLNEEIKEGLGIIQRQKAMITDQARLLQRSQDLNRSLKRRK